LYSSFSQSQSQLLDLTIAAGLSADELKEYQTAITYEELAGNSYDATNSTISTLFTDFYGGIYKANSIIEGATNGSLTASLRVRLLAEAKFLRAYCYFYLVNLFGEVPLVLETDVNVTAKLPRVSVASVYAQIIKDLTDAKADLLTDYSNSATFRYGPNKYAAAALLARVYLYTGDYAQVESQATEVIGKTDLYELIPSTSMATGVFTRNSKEAIFQFMAWLTSTNTFTAEGSGFIPPATATVAPYELTESLVNDFETGDLRRTNWVKDVTITGVLYHIPYKYKNTMSVTTVTPGEYPTILRLAEQYLIRAEARARIGDDLDGALADLNAIRTRAGLAESTTTDASVLLTEIAEEKRKELFLELGHRWFDLKRTGDADAVLGLEKDTWLPTAALYPIPQAAVDANSNLLPNNPGY
jgi:hypothetical protein